MNKELLACLLSALLPASAVPALADAVLYASDFESPVGPEWSTNHRIQTPGGTRPQTWFLGGDINGNNLGFAGDTVTLSLTNLGPHSWVQVTFDLYIINSWDGIGFAGPDYFTLAVQGGPALLYTTFANSGLPQSYPADVGGGSYPSRTGALEVNSLGMEWPNTYGDTVYRITRRVQSAASNIQFQFIGGVNEPNGQNETWGLDNVYVSADIPAGPSCLPPPPGLVAWYPADDNAANVIAGTSGTLQNGTSCAPGLVGQAFSLDGIDDVVHVPSSPSLSFAPQSPMTIELWAYRTGSASCMHLVGKRTTCGADPTAINYQMYFNVPSGQGLGFGSSSGGVNSGLDMPMNTWTHLAGTFDGSNFRLYVNGGLVATGAGTLGPQNTAPLLIGGSSDCAKFAGLIDEVSVYNRALTWGEIAAIYNADSAGKCGLPPAILTSPQGQTVEAGANVTFSVTASGTLPLSYQWQFAGANIPDATDSSFTIPSAGTNDAGAYSVVVTNAYGSIASSNAVLTVSPPPPCVTPPPGLAAWWLGEGNANDLAGTNNGALQGGVGFLAGKVGQAFSFNGVSSYVQVHSGPSLNPTGSFSIETWIYPLQDTVGTQWQHIVGKWGDAGELANQRSYSFNIVSGLALRFSISDLAHQADYSFHDFRTDSGAITLQAWNHVAAVYDHVTGTRSIFVNGVQVKSRTDTPITIYDGVAPLTFGGLVRGGGLIEAYLNGLLDEVSCYDYALSAAEIQAIYNAHSTGKCGLPPAILTSPQSQTVLAGAAVTFSVTAAGTPPLGYQWRLNGLGISGATNSTYSIASAVTGDAGNYDVVITNLVGSVTSSVAVLTVNKALATVTLADLSQTFDGTAKPVTVTTIPTGLTVNLTYDGSAAAPTSAGSYTVVGMVADANYQGSATNTLAIGKALAAVALDSLSQTHDGTPKCATVSTIPSGLLAIITYDGSPDCPSAPASYTVVGTINDANYQGSATNTLIIQPVLPFLTQQPQSQSALAGSNVTFTALAGGTPPLAYQWRKDGDAISGATNANHTIASVSAGDAGGYDVVVTSPYGSATSTVATLTVTEPPISRIFVVSTDGMSGGCIVVPVKLSALGNENALGFSLSYDPTKIAFQSAQLGAAAAMGSLFINPSFTNIGRLGIAVSQPYGVSFHAGTQEVVRISFLTQPMTNTVSTTVAFADVPTGRQLVDSLANILPATYAAGTVTLTPVDLPPVEYEADVWPRTNGDHAVTIADWVQVGRFVAGLDLVASDDELLRADCAPRANLGNGHLTVTDWVQAGRYAVGLDPLTPVGGPTAAHLSGFQPLAAKALESEVGDQTRILEMGTLSGHPGQTITVPILLHALGDENALGFSVAFDPTLLDFTDATPGAGAVGASVNLNAAAAGQGKVGVVIAQSPGDLFAAGTQQVAVLQFAIRREATNDAAVAFTDSPVVGEVSDAAANVLPTSYVDGQLAINPPPALRIEQQGSDVVISWPASSGAFLLQSAQTLPATSWDEVAKDIVTNGSMATVTIPATNANGYFRLKDN